MNLLNIFSSSKKPIERICKNCIAYDGKNHICKVIILHEGEKINIPVSAKDPCFFEQKVINPETKQEETLNDIEQVKMWVEDKEGNKVDGHGTVKIEYPMGFVPKQVN